MAIYIPSLDYSSAPTADHVAVKIKGANWWPTDTDQIAAAESTAEIAVRAATRQFLRIVRWEPFIADQDNAGVGIDSIRYFNKVDEQGRVFFGDGLLRLSSVTVLGRAYTVNDTAFLGPDNAAAKDKPYTYLQLWPSNYGSSGGSVHENYWRHNREMKPRSIVVTGVWGFSLTWPEDAFEAIISRAANLTLSSVNQESELSSISEDGFTESYDLVGPVDQKTAMNEWGKYFDSVANRYAGMKPKPGPATVNTGAYAQQNSRSYLPLV